MGVNTSMSNDSELKSLLRRAGNNLAVIDQIAGHCLQNRYPLHSALRAYKKYLKQHPTSVNALFNYAYYLGKDGQFESAVEIYRHSLRLGIRTPEEVHLNIANIYMDQLKNPELAKEHLQQALLLNPNYASAYYNLGNLSEQDGAREESKRCFQKALEFDPLNHSALARLADAHKFSSKNEALLTRLIATAKTSNNIDLHFALGRAYEQLGIFDLAWQHFFKANMLDKSSYPAYRAQQTNRVFHQIMEQCSREWLERHRGKSDDTVFICGMFRTGSTLLEQMLAAHPGFLAGGESTFFPRLVSKQLQGFPHGLDDISTEQSSSWRNEHSRFSSEIYGDSFRVTDKRPDNFLHIGLIKAVLPSAKFIVTERDWRDVATSVYSTRLGAGQNYATDLKSIHHYIGLQKELVDHWQTIIGSDLIRISYEDLVTRPRDTISKLLHWLGEDWDESCLDFNKLRNTVQTASVWQVREPLHCKSIGRWKNYATHFEDIFDANT